MLVARVTERIALLGVQQAIDLRHVVDVGRRARHGVHQTRVGVCPVLLSTIWSAPGMVGQSGKAPRRRTQRHRSWILCSSNRHKVGLQNPVRSAV